MFTEIKYRARLLMRRKTTIAFLLFAARIPPFAGAVFSGTAIAGCAYFGSENLTGFAFLSNGWYKAAFYAFLSFACIFFVLFYSAVSFSARSYFEHFAAGGCRPKVFFTFGQAFRYLRCALLKGVYAVLWAVLFLSPGALVAATVFVFLQSGEMYLPVFLVLSACAAALLTAGFGFFSVSLTRYFLCEYLLCTNPRMPVRDVIAESTFLMHGRGRKTVFLILSFLPWMLLCVIPFFFPFVYTFIKTACAKMSNVYFGEEQTGKKHASAIVYYINSATKFAEHTEEQGSGGSAALGNI